MFKIGDRVTIQQLEGSAEAKWYTLVKLERINKVGAPLGGTIIYIDEKKVDASKHTTQLKRQGYDGDNILVGGGGVFNFTGGVFV